MKKFKKVMALGLALALIFSTMGNVFAYTLDDEVYSGIQVDKTFYPVQYIGQYPDEFDDVFGQFADTSKVILDFNGFSGKFSEYLAADPDNFDTWAAAHPTAANPEFIMINGVSVPVEEQEPELTVESATVVNGTTIDVVFSDNSTARITGLQLAAGTHDYSFIYNGKSYIAEDVTYYPPTPSEATVEKVELVDYRHMKVTFSTEVDEETAEDPANYYLELVEGSAEYSAAFMGISNQLQDIDTDYPGYAAGWWSEDVDENEEPDHIVARVISGKTVVDIYLPEDSRFTNELDINGYDDDEETIIANMANLVNLPLGNKAKAMIKDVTVNVGVRNVRDEDGERTIDTKVLPMLILDETAPEFLGFEVVNASVEPGQPTASREVVELLSDGSDTVALEFDEPVFDAHGLGVDDINNTQKYNIAVYVDNNLAGSRETHDLDDVLTFAMSDQNTYDQARFATLNVKNAIVEVYGESAYKGCREFRISIIGITDLAGNTQVPNPVEFTAKICDPDPDNPDPVIPEAPEVLDVVQIHDNAFRVIFNRGDVYANFEIVNADGEDGVLDVAINGGQKEYKNKDGEILYYYSDVFVPAVDVETTVDNEINGKNDGILAYDNYNTLIRKVRVYGVTAGELEGATWCEENFVITKDVYAPEYAEPVMIKYVDIADGELTIHVEDRVPNTWEEVGQPVFAMLYDYNYGINNVFEPTINVEDTEEYNRSGPDWSCDSDLLPIKVSYVDKDGATHAALVTNKWLSEDFTWMYAWDWPLLTTKPGWNEGYPGAIKYHRANGNLVIDLSNYPQLTDEDGQLIPGVTYTVEIPDGYFADRGKKNAYNPGEDNVLGETEILYVSDGRQNNEGSFIVRGYVAKEAELDIDVEDVPDEISEPIDDAVPQTSKLLINYAQEANEIWVEFTGQIKESTLEDADHYKVNGMTLRELGLTDSAVEYIKQVGNYETEERQFAKIELGYDTIAISGDYTFEVFGVTNEAGGMMTPVSTRIDLIENTRPVVEETRISAEGQIVLVFDEALMYGDDVNGDAINAGVAARENFQVILDGEVTLTPATAVLSEEDHKTVTLSLTGVDFSEYDSVVVNIVEDQNDQMNLEDISDNHNPIKAEAVVVK